jgi:hypothetical protein
MEHVDRFLKMFAAAAVSLFAVLALWVVLFPLIGEDGLRLVGLAAGAGVIVLAMWWWATGFPGEKQD